MAAEVQPAEVVVEVGAEPGERGVLTRDPVRIFEPTSGTTSGEKLIPYTADLQHQFQRAISAWIGDLFSAGREVVEEYARRVASR